MLKNKLSSSDTQLQGAADYCRPLLVVAAALFNQKGECLLSRRPQGKQFAGLWEFPGGKVEKDETVPHALVREIKEELAIDLLPEYLSEQPVATVATDAIKIFLYAYPVTLASPNYNGKSVAYPDIPPLNPLPQEGQKCMWVKMKDLKKYPMPRADILLCEQNWYSL